MLKHVTHHCLKFCWTLRHHIHYQVPAAMTKTQDRRNGLNSYSSYATGIL